MTKEYSLFGIHLPGVTRIDYDVHRCEYRLSYPEGLAIIPEHLAQQIRNIRHIAEANMILIIAGRKEEAIDFVNMMGFQYGSWKYVSHYRDMLSYRDCSVYIVGTGRQRNDFGAIEGLFLMGNHTVMDMDE